MAVCFLSVCVNIIIGARALLNYLGGRRHPSILRIKGYCEENLSTLFELRILNYQSKEPREPEAGTRGILCLICPS
jgi:hypothetical protein